jgi:hypothetical protein
LDYHAFGCETLFFEQGTLRAKAGNCGIASLMRVGLHSRYGFPIWRIREFIPSNVSAARQQNSPRGIKTPDS